MPLSTQVYKVESMYCVLRQDTLLSQCLSPPRCIRWSHCIVFLGKTLYSHSDSLHPGVQSVNVNMLWGVTLWCYSISFRWIRNTLTCSHAMKTQTSPLLSNRLCPPLFRVFIMLQYMYASVKSAIFIQSMLLLIMSVNVVIDLLNLIHWTAP